MASLPSPGLVAATLLALLATACGPGELEDHGPTAYQTELDTISGDIAASEVARGEDPRVAMRHVYHLYRRAGMTADPAHFRAVEEALDDVRRRFGISSQWLAFDADLNFKLHRLERAETAIAAVAGSPHARVLGADIALQMGRYDEALAAYRSIVDESPEWENLARLAYVYGRTGEPDEADALYVKAQDRLSVKQLRHFAWVELQRGVLDLDHRRFVDALEHYLRAERAYPGYWLVREHIAEVYDLLGRTSRAIEVYEGVIESTGHPEFIGALAVIVERYDRGRAAALHQRAESLFRQRYALYPEAALGHYIEYLLSRRTVDPRLVPYASRNHSIRPSAESKLLLARAYLKAGQRDAARRTMEQILRTPWRTPEIEALAARLVQYPG